MCVFPDYGAAVAGGVRDKEKAARRRGDEENCECVCVRAFVGEWVGVIILYRSVHSYACVCVCAYL